MIRRAMTSAAVVGVALALIAGVAEARIVGVRVDRVDPFVGGAAFGAVGPYERVVGVARGEIDPLDPRNAGIVNIDKVARNARGLVEYETDLYIVRPADPARGNGKILYEVPFPRAQTDREGRGDPRPSLVERYVALESYVRQVEAVAAELVAARLLLPEDAERYVATARAARPF